MLENTRVCYIGPNITGFITVFLTSVQKRSNLGLARAVFGKRRNITVPCYVYTFSCSIHASLPLVRVTVPTGRSRYR